MQIRALLRQLTKGPVFWRYMDAFAPRLFGLVFHSLILHRFGSSAYALPAWIIGVFGILVALIPDPHGYILVRGHGPRARRLFSLVTPYLLAKMLLAALATGFCVPLFVSHALRAAQHGSMTVIVICTTSYAATEALWGALGQVSLALGNVRQVAITAIASRLCGLAILVGVDYFVQAPLALYLFGYTLPLALSCLLLFPWQWHLPRILSFAGYGLKRYALWSQGIGLTTSLLAQFTPLGMGMFEAISAQQVGQIAFINRLVLAALTPLQVLQSVVIQAYAQGGNIAQTQRYRRVFKLSALALITFGTYETLKFKAEGLIDPSSALATLLILLGVSIFCWFRYEISAVLASTRIRDLFLRGYLPVAVGTILAAILLGNAFGVIGLGAVALLSWAGLSFSWKWIPPTAERGSQ